jgi:hypothetical protein
MRYRVTVLPAGIVELDRPMDVAPGMELRGAPGGTTLHMANGFQGAAAVVVQGDNVRLHDFEIDGNRAALEMRQGLPEYDQPFSRFTTRNGILVDGKSRVQIDHVRLRNVSGFAILASRTAYLQASRITVIDSGSRNPAGRNNATGGILVEEGSSHFVVEASSFRNILGNALWTHSLYRSARNRDGVFARNQIDRVGRDAIQAGHATAMRVEDNIMTHVGFPVDATDLEARAIPVGIDTAGNVDATAYVGNRIAEINGKCMDLDGLHDSEIRGNECVNSGDPKAYPLANYAIVMNDTNPDMKTRNIRIVGNRVERMLFGAIFVIGERNIVERNLLLDLNLAHCNQNVAHYACMYAAADPQLLASGIYLGRGAERPAPARGNVVRSNVITGWGMKLGCVTSAPDIPAAWNMVKGNECIER